MAKKDKTAQINDVLSNLPANPTIADVQDAVSGLVEQGLNIHAAAHSVAHQMVVNGLFGADEENDVADGAEDVARQAAE